MKKAKILAAALALVVACMPFTGCGGQSTSSSAAPASGAVSSGAAGQEEPVKLTAYISHISDTDRFPMPVLETLAQEANVEIEWTVMNMGDWRTQKSVILASGELPDIVFGCAMTDADVSTGSFIDLAPYIDSAPNIKRFFEESPDAMAMAADTEGAIYALPGQPALRPYSGDVLYVNQVWLDQLGMEAPTTTEEFFDMLVRFRDEDPNGNGIQDEIGFSGYAGGGGTASVISTAGELGWVFPAFGVVMNHSDTYCMVKDGVPEFQPVTDNYRAAVEYIARMWKENLMDHEFWTLDFNGCAAKYRSDPLTVGAGSGWTVANNAGDNAQYYTMIEPLEGPNGDKYWNSSAYFYKLNDNRAAISTNCKNVEAAMRFLDVCYEEYAGLQLAYGSEGVAVGRDSAGNPTFLETPDGYTDEEWSMMNSMGIGAPAYASPEFEASITGENTNMDKLEADEFYSQWFLEESRMPYVTYDNDTLAELSILQTDINEYVLQSLATFITDGVTDQSWNAYVERIDAMGLDRLMEIYTEGYNSVA